MGPGDDALSDLLRRLNLPSKVVELRPLKPDTSTEPDAKVSGYGKPVRVVTEDERGKRHSFVLHLASPNEFGHDRRADRADELLLSFDTYGTIPRHVEPLDFGFIAEDRFISVGQAGEPYVLTRWAEGRPYAEDLRRVAREGAAELDVQRCRALATYLGSLHAQKLSGAAIYRRAIRDLLGHGEGIFGIIDGYPSPTPSASADRLHAIERQCLEWRWRLRDHCERLARIHGDFHPFNILFARDSELSLVDASRGCAGDPADDVAALAINYLFFALDQPDGWRHLRPLWHQFWQTYLAASGDEEVLEVIAPFFAWRGLVVANPKFYPALSDDGRDRLFRLLERTLAAPRFDVAWADDCAR
jgi:aminoglycoside phosphotransferase (APT) family kinase protein